MAYERKKFTAAEKHFTKLRERYERQIKYLLIEISGLREKNSSLEQENRTLIKQVETYRELLGVEVDDMKSRRERLERSDKLLAELFTAINLTR
jgi:FtsZ-binding cell division protein ZapB